MRSCSPSRYSVSTVSFPLLPLGEAVERLIAFEKYYGRRAAPIDKAGLVWDLKQVGDILASLRYYGFVEYTGGTDSRQVAMTEEARHLIRLLAVSGGQGNA
jgi:hypothetical protein